ncbi:MAG TPA: hypothetical protein VM899_02105 [Rubellimicrobium sp.]|nr:hypothetical protein [Rubellimicrobium sp.]
MALARLTASMAALLLSSTALLAQQDATTGQSVILDVGGTPILVPIALATQACDLDEAGVQQASQSRIEQSGLGNDAVQQIFAATAPVGTTNSTGAPTTDTPAAGTAGSSTETATAGLSGDAAGEGAATSPGTLGAGADTTSTADAANTPAPGGEPVNVEELDGSTDMAASDNAATAISGVLEGAETTAADSTALPDTDTSAAQGLDSDAASNEQLLTLAVCQVEITRAGELGIGGAYEAGMDASGG